MVLLHDSCSCKQVLSKELIKANAFEPLSLANCGNVHILPETAAEDPRIILKASLSTLCSGHS